MRRGGVGPKLSMFPAMDMFRGCFPPHGKWLERVSAAWKTRMATMQGLVPIACLLLSVAAGGGCRSVKASRLAVPKPVHWTASASASAEGRGPEQALDAQTNTWWRSGAADPQWIAVDLGRAAMVCGLGVDWGEPHATAYAVHTSLDGVHWALSHEANETEGGREEVLFAPILARHVRVGVSRSLQGSGAAVRTLDIMGLADRPLLWADGVPMPDALALLDGDPETTWRSPDSAAVIEMDLRRQRPIGSVRVDWGPAGFASNVTVEVSTNRADWVSAGQIVARAGDFDVLMGERIHPARFVRLSFSGGSPESGFEVAGISLRGEEGKARPWAMYELAAAQAPEGIYPEVFRRRQTYWTVAGGLQEGDAEALLNEWGGFSPGVRSPMLSPLVLTADGAASARQAETLEHRLADDGTPLPETVWRLRSGLRLRIRAMSRPGADPPMSWVNLEMVNESIMTQTGRLVCVVRPVRLPPPWAGGGLAPIYRIRNVETAGGWQELWVNGHRFLGVPDPGVPFGAAAFNGGDAAEFFLRGEAPSFRSVRDDEGLASAAWWMDFDLEPGERVRWMAAAPDPEAHATASLRRYPWPEMPGGMEKAADRFDREWVDAAWKWRAETDRYAPRVARPDAVDALQSQVGWLTGIRALANGGEGETVESMAWRVAALLRTGQAARAREWIDRVAGGMNPDGRVPPVFRAGGRPMPSAGDEGCPGTQGQWAFMVMEYYRFTQDAEFLQSRYPELRRAMGYLHRMRAGLEKAEARLPVEERERVEGLLPPGGGRTVRTYAEHYWALLGWKELRTAASILGLDRDATWADDQYRALKASVRRSLRFRLDRSDVSWLPAVVEEDGFDADSVALLFWPCEETDLVEPHELQSSLDRFYEQFLHRGEDGSAVHWPSTDARLLVPLSMMGRGDYAREVLYDLLAARQPRGWHGWADVAMEDPRKPGRAGFMPDLEAAATYVTAVRGLAARESGGGLELLSGAPAEWLQHGDGYRVFGMPTAYGPLDLHAYWHRDRLRVEIGGTARPPGGYRIWWPRQVAPERVMANGEALKDFDAVGVRLPHDFSGTVEAVFPYLAPWPRDP